MIKLKISKSIARFFKKRPVKINIKLIIDVIIINLFINTIYEPIFKFNSSSCSVSNFEGELIITSLPELFFGNAIKSLILS